MASRKFQKLKKRKRSGSPKAHALRTAQDQDQRHANTPSIGSIVQAQVLARVQRMTEEEAPVMIRRQPLLHEWRRPGHRFVPPAKQPVMR